MKPIRIALSGKMRAGKDTLANELIMRHGFVRVAFADKLKEIAKDLFKMQETDKNRALLQEMGRKLRSVDIAVWISSAIAAMPMWQHVVVTDLRYPNEYYALKGLGFYLVRIEIDAKTQRERYEKTEGRITFDEFLTLRSDSSECLLDHGFPWDLIIDGTAPVQEMYEVLTLLLEHLIMEADHD